MRLPRLYPILDVDLLASRGCTPLEAAEAMLEGAAEMLQLRCKWHFSRDVFEQAERIAAACGDRQFIVNDRADMALLIPRAGLHVGQDDLLPSIARSLIGADRVLGHSTHNATQLAQADREPVDYLAIGPIFSTASKTNPDPVVGVNGLKDLRRLTSKPLVAIGGITRENALAVLAAGADCVALISDLYPEPCRKPQIRARMEEWHKLLTPPR